MKIILILALIATVAYLFLRFSFEKSLEKTIPYGPFTIKVKATTDKSFNMNYGKMVTHTNVSYGILYNGKPVAFSGALQNNTGLPFMWRVYALTGAPDHTLVAGSQSLYMIYLKDGAPVVEPLLQQGYDFASLQFLDGENGRPGPYEQVYANVHTTNLDYLDTLDGGRYLMVSEHAVLDVQTRQLWPLNKDNDAVDNYSFPTPHGALAFSPDHKSIVFRANFQSWNTSNEQLPDSEHALVVYDYTADKGYCLPFDDTALRLQRANLMDFAWFESFFVWEKTPVGDRLAFRKLDQVPYWKGEYDISSNYYNLYPVKPDMLPVFLDFVLQQMGWTKDNIVQDETKVYVGRTIQLASGDLKLNVNFQEDERQISLSKHLYTEDTPAYHQMVQKIAQAFDAELAAGKHQTHFGRVINQTKRIMGME